MRRFQTLAIWLVPVVTMVWSGSVQAQITMRPATAQAMSKVSARIMSSISVLSHTSDTKIHDPLVVERTTRTCDATTDGSADRGCTLIIVELQ